MATHELAMEAIKELDGKSLNGRPVRLNWAKRNCRLHVGNLDPELSEPELAAAFREYGDLIESDTIIYKTGKGGNFAQIHFKNREDAERAKAELTGMLLGIRPLYIEWNQLPFKQGRVARFNSNTHENGPVVSIYVQFETVEVINIL